MKTFEKPDKEQKISLPNHSNDFEITKENILTHTFINITSSTLGFICLFFMETINLSFMGHTNQSSSYVDAVGLGNIYMNFAGVMIGFGFLGALDTIGSHAYGSKNYKLLGIFTFHSRVILHLLFIFVILPLFIYSDKILFFLPIENSLVINSSFYIKYMIPAIFLTFNFNTNVRYLQVMQIYFFPSFIVTISLFIHYFLCHFFVFKMNFGIFAVCLATTITMLFNLISTSVFIIYYNPYPESLIIYDSSVLNIKQFFSYLVLTIYSGFQHYGESIGYEVVSFMTCFLSAEDMASNLIILNYINLFGFIYLGLNFPLTHFIGYFLGKSDFDMYKYTVKIFAILNFFFSIGEFLFTYIFSLEICNFYTHNIEIAKVSSNLLKIYSIFLVLDTINIMFQSILKGAAMQKVISIWNLILTFGFMIPAGYLLCFIFGFGLDGLWMACGLFVSISMFIYMFYFISLDYKEAAQILFKQITEEENENSYYALID